MLERIEAERWRTALESIAKNTCCDRCQEAALVAQAALKDQFCPKCKRTRNDWDCAENECPMAAITAGQRDD